MDHIIISGKTFHDRSGIGFKGESSTSKIIFIKSGLLIDLVDPSKMRKIVISSVSIKVKPAIQQIIATN